MAEFVGPERFVAWNRFVDFSANQFLGSELAEQGEASEYSHSTAESLAYKISHSWQYDNSAASRACIKLG